MFFTCLLFTLLFDDGRIEESPSAERTGAIAVCGGRSSVVPRFEYQINNLPEYETVDLDTGTVYRVPGFWILK